MHSMAAVPRLFPELTGGEAKAPPVLGTKPVISKAALPKSLLPQEPTLLVWTIQKISDSWVLRSGSCPAVRPRTWSRDLLFGCPTPGITVTTFMEPELAVVTKVRTLPDSISCVR